MLQVKSAIVAGLVIFETTVVGELVKGTVFEANTDGCKKNVRVLISELVRINRISWVLIFIQTSHRNIGGPIARALAEQPDRKYPIIKIS